MAQPKATKTYVGLPVEVEASVIVAVTLYGDTVRLSIRNPDGGPVAEFAPDPAMMARMKPFPGDYVVQQSDGYIYLNPKDVFERKYKAKPEPAPEAAPARAEG